MRGNGTSKKFALVFAVLILCSFNAFHALAMNYDYLSAEKWMNNDKVTITAINKSGVKGSLTGKYGYYADNASMCVYTYFSVKESTYTADSDVQIAYRFVTETEEYLFSANENGLNDGAEEAAKTFEVRSNFTKNSDNGCFISAAQYNGDEDFCSVEVDLFVNGHKYLVQEGLTLTRPVSTNPWTTKSPKTTKVKTTISKKSKKAATEKSTKYIPKRYLQQNNTKEAKPKNDTKEKPAANSKKETTEKNNAVGETKRVHIPYAVKNSVSHISKGSFAIFIICGILSLAGLILIFAALITKDKKDEQNKDVTE